MSELERENAYWETAEERGVTYDARTDPDPGLPAMPASGTSRGSYRPRPPGGRGERMSSDGWHRHSHYEVLCWDCHEPIRGEEHHVPSGPPVVSSSAHVVCSSCALRRDPEKPWMRYGVRGDA